MQKSSVVSLGRLSTGAALLGSILLLAAAEAEAGERVGVAAAVTPQATSQPPGGGTKILKIGKEVVYNERIDTSESGAGALARRLDLHGRSQVEPRHRQVR